MFKNILFDLDGTLTDPAIGITNSVMYALNKYNIKVSDRSELYKFIGPPLITSFKSYYGFTEAQAMDAVAFYREYYAPKGIYENVLYDDIPRMLNELKSMGCKIYLATSKPEDFAIKILKFFQIDQYFDFIGGATMDEKRTTKIEVIKYVIEKGGIEDMSKAVMVGDREYDILGAHNVGMPSIGVLYGYGSLRELSGAGANYYANTAMDIVKIVKDSDI